MPSTIYRTPQSLRSYVRTAQTLSGADSLSRAVRLLRGSDADWLPVVEEERLIGVVRLPDLLPLLNTPAEMRTPALAEPVTSVLRPVTATCSPETTPAEAGLLCATNGMTAVPVADEDGYYLGAVYAVDLLQPEAAVARPGRIGGMATPFGVYLTDGTLQAGAGNLALAATGAIMGLLFIVAAMSVSSGIWLLQRYAHVPDWPGLSLGDASLRDPAQGLLAILVHLLFLLLFLSLLRATRIARYHAAEHQVVHAVERSEPLEPGIVRRMPRAHPRCGTNLMAGVMVFYVSKQALDYVPVLAGVTTVMAALCAAFTWRRVGTFLQERFTTRTAGDRELLSGIAAAQSLLDQYAESPLHRPRLLRRLWCMGMAQTAAGMAVCLGLFCLAVSAWPWAWNRLVTGGW